MHDLELPASFDELNPGQVPETSRPYDEIFNAVLKTAREVLKAPPGIVGSALVGLEHHKGRRAIIGLYGYTVKVQLQPTDPATDRAALRYVYGLDLSQALDPGAPLEAIAWLNFAL